MKVTIDISFCVCYDNKGYIFENKEGSRLKWIKQKFILQRR